VTTALAGGRVRRTLAHLADGREILYFDDSPGYVTGDCVRQTTDTRDLPPAGGGSELRLDALSGEWVAIASHRNDRTFLPPKNECPLCPTGRGVMPSEVPASDYDVVVFENRFPSLSTRVEGLPHDIDGEPLFRARPGVGRC
jgi:UDPglucose--hexose-1-phosphate uridylyltransferase